MAEFIKNHKAKNYHKAESNQNILLGDLFPRKNSRQYNGIYNIYFALQHRA